MPKSVTPVNDFELDKYLGKWYEIARLDHSFERGMEQVTAEYSLREDGSVQVKNRGFSKKNNKWSEAEGKAFVSGPNTSYLWLLSRTPTVDEDILSLFIQKAKNLGFDTEKLFYVNQE